MTLIEQDEEGSIPRWDEQAPASRAELVRAVELRVSEGGLPNNRDPAHLVGYRDSVVLSRRTS